MRTNTRVWNLFVAMVGCVATVPARAGVIEFSNQAEWEAAVGSFTTIDFTGFPEFTIITTQYQDLGVLFTDGNDSIDFNDAFLNDGVGLRGGSFDDIEISFTTPQAWIAVDFPGVVRIFLFSGGELIHFSTFGAGPGGGGFGGLVSTEPFDSVVLTDPLDDFVFIDDLHFGGAQSCPSDLNGDGVVNVLDLIDLLVCFGQPAVPGCEAADVNGDGTVNVLDLIELLLAFGTVCP